MAERRDTHPGDMIANRITADARARLLELRAEIAAMEDDAAPGDTNGPQPSEGPRTSRADDSAR